MLTELQAEILSGEQGAPLLGVAMEFAADRVDSLRAVTRLRRLADPALAAAAWDLADLRRRAASSMGEWASELFYDRDAYQMASATGCARYRAGLVAATGAEHILDLCAGVGIDAVAFAQRGIRVTAYEREPSRAVFARANARTMGFGGLIDVVTADVTRVDFPADVTTAFLDPARRDETRKRIVSADDIQPPLSFLGDLKTKGVASVLVKLSPAIDRQLGEAWSSDTEFLSESGECKEALLRTGAFRTGAGMSAVLTQTGERLDAPAPVAAVAEEIGGWLYEPDPAVIRAGLVGYVAAAVDGWLIDPQIAYVLSNREVATPFADRYRVEAGFPYHRKRLQEELAARDAGRVVIKRRAFPEEPEAVRKQLKLSGSQERVVILTRSGQRLWAMIAVREASQP